MDHVDHADRASHESDDARDDVRWGPPSRPRSGRLTALTIVGSSSRRGQRKRRLRWQAARLWGAAARAKRRLPAVGEGSATRRESLSPGVWRALAQIRAADPLGVYAPDAAPAANASEAQPLRRVAEERAPYEADTKPRETDAQA